MTKSSTPSNLKPLPRGTNATSPEVGNAVLVLTKLVQTYEMGNSPVYHEKMFDKKYPSVPGKAYYPGHIFGSMAEVRATGLSQEMIDRYIKKGVLVYRTLEQFVRGGLGKPVTPMVLGNTGKEDGSKVYHNKPGVKFGYHPENLKNYDLGELQTMIVENDPSITPPDSIEGCREILSSNH